MWIWMELCIYTYGCIYLMYKIILFYLNEKKDVTIFILPRYYFSQWIFETQNIPLNQCESNKRWLWCGRDGYGGFYETYLSEWVFFVQKRVTVYFCGCFVSKTSKPNNKEEIIKIKFIFSTPYKTDDANICIYAYCIQLEIYCIY